MVALSYSSMHMRPSAIRQRKPHTLARPSLYPDLHVIANTCSTARIHTRTLLGRPRSSEHHAGQTRQTDQTRRYLTPNLCSSLLVLMRTSVLSAIEDAGIYDTLQPARPVEHLRLVQPSSTPQDPSPAWDETNRSELDRRVRVGMRRALAGAVVIATLLGIRIAIGPIRQPGVPTVRVPQVHHSYSYTHPTP